MTSPSTNDKQLVSRCNPRMDARMSPRDLPEQLQPLMEGLAKKNLLTAAIYQYHNVFSSGPADMDVLIWSLTPFMQENIIPYIYHLGISPSHKQEVEKIEVKKCWTEVLLSHARVAGPIQLFWLPRKMAGPGSLWTTGRSMMSHAKMPTHLPE